MKEKRNNVVGIRPYKDKLGRGIRWSLKGEGKIRGLIIVSEKNPETEVVTETVTYRQECGMRPIGLQSDGKQSLQLAWDMFHGQSLVVKKAKDGGIYSKGRRTREGKIIGGTFEWWLEGDLLCRSNRPDVTGSRREFFAREVYCQYDEKRDVIIVNDLPEFMHKGSGWVYNTEGVADERSEARRRGELK